MWYFFIFAVQNLRLTVRFFMGFENIVDMQQQESTENSNTLKVPYEKNEVWEPLLQSVQSTVSLRRPHAPQGGILIVKGDSSKLENYQVLKIYCFVKGTIILERLKWDMTQKKLGNTGVKEYHFIGRILNKKK